MTIGVPRAQQGELLQDEIREAYRVACSVLEDNGANLVDVDLPDYLQVRAVQAVISYAEGAEYHRIYSRTRLADYSEGLQRRILIGEIVPALDYIHAQRVRGKILQAYEAVMDEVDVLALPVTATVAPAAGASVVQIDELHSEPLMRALNRYAPAFNLTGQPAISLLCGFDSLGLPISFQLAGRWFDDAELLRIAAVYQSSTTWHLRHPT